MSFYQRHVLPRLLHVAMRQEALRPFRERVIGAAEGRVLEVGMGSGINLPLYGSQVRAVIGLESSPELLHMARARAETARVPVELLEASAEAIPLESGNIDSRDNLDALHHPRRNARARRDSPRLAAGGRPAIRRTRPRAGARCCHVGRIGSIRSGVAPLAAAISIGRSTI